MVHFLSLTSSLLLLSALSGTSAAPGPGSDRKKCRTTVEDPAWPSNKEWSKFNKTVSGHLVEAVPTAEYCRLKGGCSDAEWTGGFSRAVIPGSTCYTNWEGDYETQPFSTCFRNSTESDCSQGRVAIYSVLAESVKDIKNTLKFGRDNDLRISVRSSGHDMLGRSTLKSSLQIDMQKFQSIEFHDNFKVGRESLGSAVTVGTGVGLYTLGQAAKAVGKTAVLGTAASVSPGGGWFQAGGHGSMSTRFGLGADNVLEFSIVLADGRDVTANKNSYSDLFWAVRGGGPGTWGVITSVTFQVFESFPIALVVTDLFSNSSDTAAELATIHAKHIYDLENFPTGAGGEYLLGYAEKNDDGSDRFHLNIVSYLPDITTEADAVSSMSNMTNELKAVSGVQLTQTVALLDVNDGGSVDDITGYNAVVGSRLIPAEKYKSDPEGKGQLFKELLLAAKEYQSIVGDASYIFDMNILGGKVAENAKVNNAIFSQWRTAKTHLGVVNQFPDTHDQTLYDDATLFFQQSQEPLITAYTGAGAKGYSSENDVLDPDFINTYYGDYARLSKVKAKYDPKDVFIVPTGVGAERWSFDGNCKA